MAYSALQPLLSTSLIIGALLFWGRAETAMGQSPSSLQPRLSYHYQMSATAADVYQTNTYSRESTLFRFQPPSTGWSVEATDPPAVGWLAAGGAAGFSVGLVGGAFIGGLINQTLLQVQLLGAGALTGGILGATTMTPLGVHLASGRRGNYLSGLLASAAATCATLFLMGEVKDGSEPYVAAGGVIAQISLSTFIEWATAK